MSKVFSKKNFYLLFVCVITLLVIIITPTFAKFSSNYVVENDVVGLSLDFDISVSNIEEYDKVVAKANDITLFNVEVNNISSNTVYYGIWYRLNNANLTSSDIRIYRLDDSLYTTSGDLSGNTEKTVSLVVVNNTNTSIKLDIGVASSTVGTSDIEYLGGRKLVSGIYTINYMKSLYNIDGEYYKSEEYIDNIKSVSFVDYIETDTSKIVMSWDVSKKDDNSIVAWLENNTESGYYDLYIGSKNKIYSEDLGGFFGNLINLTSVTFNNLDTSLTTNMNSMFDGCENLTALDLSSFDTSKVTDMGYMFRGCYGLTSLDLSSFDTGNVTSMNYMFWDCVNLSNLNLSSFNTSNVTTMREMFFGCESLTSLDLSNFNTSNVTIMQDMFSDCESLTRLDLSEFNTSNVINMSGMFNGCVNLIELDLSIFDTSNVVDMHYMFVNCNKLSTTITIKNASVFDYASMFSDAATESNVQIIVNYTSATSTLVDNMIATKSSTSNVVKGSLVA